MGFSLTLLGMLGVGSFLAGLPTPAPGLPQGSGIQTNAIWIEGEAPSSFSIEPSFGGTSHPEYLSGAKWLTIGIDGPQVDGKVPGPAAELTYKFTASDSKQRQLWARLGFEQARSPFDWKLDDGPWNSIAPTQFNVDTMELDTWTEVGWLQLGNVQVSAGEHTLSFRIRKTKNEKGETDRLLFGLDAIALTDGNLLPNSKFKPGEYRGDPADAAAAAKVFEVPLPKGAARAEVPLAGLWQIARHDENEPKNIGTPLTSLPSQPIWTGIAVPGDKAVLRHDLIFAHRVWYRTRINVPAGLEGRSFHLDFPGNSLNTTVFVNGVFCGFEKNPFVKFQIDITKGVRPGINEVWVGIRDSWYAWSENPTKTSKLRGAFNIPRGMIERGGFMQLAYPIWGHFESGILGTPTLVVAGATKTTDVFVQPSVADKKLVVDVSVSNPSSAPFEGELRLEAQGKNGVVFPAQKMALAPGESKTVRAGGAWANPELWWPDRPTLYTLRTTLVADGKEVDIHDQPFGFREWSSRGKDFLLNGVVWRVWGDCHTASTPEQWLAQYRQTNQRMMRFWDTQWMGMTPDKALSWFDRNGVVVRRSGMLDGQAIGYSAIETDPDLRQLNGSEVKLDLMRNWKDQMVAQVKAERNHPSIMLWSLENEWLYINCINLYGNLMDEFEREVTAVSKAVLATDPTRLTMTDGGGANKDQSMPVHGNHYVYDPNSTRYPALAYEANPDGGGRGRWQWDQKRPRFIGEDFFANGINPFDYALYGGEATFQGKAASREAAGRIYRMLTEGYRWAGYGGWHLWMGQESAVNQYGSNPWVAAFIKEQDSTFGAGESVARTAGVFNDSRFGAPIKFSWTLSLGAKMLAKEDRTLNIPAGQDQRFAIRLPMPVVATRQDLTLRLKLSQNGKEVFADAKTLSVLPARAALVGPQPLPALGAKNLVVWDPSGKVGAFLRSQAVGFRPISSLAGVDAATLVLVVGPNALDEQEGARSRLAALAEQGKRIIVLEQANPVRYQGLPAEMEVAKNEGRIAYLEDASHPALRGLTDRDFYTWGADQVVYRNAYLKPIRGAKSLIQCEPRLANSALSEVPVGQGLMLLCQIRVGEKLASSAVARQLLVNLLGYSARYKLTYRPVTLIAGNDLGLSRAVETAGVRHSKSENLVAALSLPGEQTLVVTGTPAHLRTLSEQKAKVDAFVKQGGWILLSGLEPSGLADFNRLVGFNHMIRPFRRERVSFPARRHPLTAGLSAGDIVMQSGRAINGFTSDVYAASDVFSYVVDTDDIAPFAKFPAPKYFGYDSPDNDHDPLNMVNGFVSSDGWQYIFSINHMTAPTQFDLSWPTPQKVREIEWTGNAFYDRVTKLDVSFDGGALLRLDVQPNNEPQRLAIAPARTGTKLSLKLAEWQTVGTVPVVGVDNLRLFADRPANFASQVQPLLNIGALVAYPRGKGGIVLSNILFQERESVPENALKKTRILASILRNLKAPFAGAASVIAGSALTYTSIDLSKRANQYRDERGWFGDKNFTFKDMPKGRQEFAGVPYLIYEFPTSPVPTAIMLGGPGIPNNLSESVDGITVGVKADALFFLQAFRVDAGLADWEVREKRQYEVAKYVVEYADGQTVEVPLIQGADVANYRQENPSSIPGSQVAWVHPFAGTKEFGVAYAKQWNNPRQEVVIRQVSLRYGKDRRGVPALLALTAAKRAK
ncbi:MAG: sugar-binding domain-containing protein [Fimbriimonas sp.]